MNGSNPWANCLFAPARYISHNKNSYQRLQGCRNTQGHVTSLHEGKQSVSKMDGLADSRVLLWSCLPCSVRDCVFGEAWALRRAGTAVRGESDRVLSPRSLCDLLFASLQGQRRTASVRVRSHEASGPRALAKFPRASIPQAELWCLEKVAFEEVLTDHLREATVPLCASEVSQPLEAAQEIMRRIEIQDLSRTSD